MNTYLKIFKSDLKYMSKTSFVLNLLNIILIFILIIHKTSILSEYSTILDIGTKKGTGIFIIVALILVNNYLFLIFNSLIKKITNALFLMLPHVRKYTLIKSGISIILLFIILLLTMPTYSEVKLYHIALIYFCFVYSYMFIFLYQRILLFKNSKLLVLKLFFGFSFIFILFSFAIFESYPISAKVIQIGFFLVFLYQIKYLIYNYLHLISPPTSSFGDTALYRYFYEIFVSKSYRPLKEKYPERLTLSQSSSIYKLFLFGSYKRYMPLLLMGLFYSWIYIEVMLGEDRTGVIFVIIFYLYIIITIVPNGFKQPFKINHLFTISGLKRINFEKSVLIAGYRTLFQFDSYLFLSAFIGVIAYNKFYKPVDLLPMINIILFLIFIQIIMIYITWIRNIKNKEYGMIKPPKPIIPRFLQKNVDTK